MITKPLEQLDKEFHEAQRELAMRRRLYPGWVAKGTLSQEQADRQIELMEGIKETVRQARQIVAMGKIR